MPVRINSLDIAGFKSIRKMDEPLSLGELNVLIGANGSGKTNLFSFLKMLNEASSERLQLYIAKHGYASAILYRGPVVTRQIVASVEFQVPALGDTKVVLPRYQFQLGHVPFNDSLVFVSEGVEYIDQDGGAKFPSLCTEPRKESSLNRRPRNEIALWQKRAILANLESWRPYHFSATLPESQIRLTCDVNDNRFLREDGGNLAALLYLFRHQDESSYRRIRDTVRLVAPFLDDFELEPDRHNRSLIRLNWRETGSDAFMSAAQLSDGTLRFICLATLLSQTQLPELIVIDEPELGLHPAAINILGGMLRSAATRTQIFVSTQSVTLVDNFEPEDIIVVDRKDDQSVFRRLDSEKLADWLEDYSIGELWQKNVVGGRP